MGAVFDLDVPATEKLVLLAMADHARDDGTGCYPSIDLLARKTSQSRRGVQKIVRRLEQSGLIVPSKVSQGRRATEYKLTIINREPGSLFNSAQPRTAGHPTANASASNREPECAQPRTGFARTVKNRQEPSGNPAATQRAAAPAAFQRGGTNANGNLKNRRLDFTKTDQELEKLRRSSGGMASSVVAAVPS
jgi:biotin operon repressor